MERGEKEKLKVSITWLSLRNRMPGKKMAPKKDCVFYLAETTVTLKSNKHSIKQNDDSSSYP